MTEEKTIEEKLQERFEQLPPVVQAAIGSAEVEEHLRKLSEQHKLHLDQWQLLENEVMLTLLGLQPAEELAHNIQKDVGVDKEAAESLAADISRIVFIPIRKELEEQLEHPNAHAGPHTEKPTNNPSSPQPTPAAVQPATPPTPKSEEKVTRAPLGAVYKSGESSAARKVAHDDPYREPPL